MSAAQYTYQAPAATMYAIQYTGSNASEIYDTVTGGLNQAKVYQSLDGSNDLQIEGFTLSPCTLPPNYWLVGGLSNGTHLDVNLQAVEPATFAAQYAAG